MQRILNAMRLTVVLITLLPTLASADTPSFATVQSDYTLTFPRDYGSHPEFRLEWWYITGWLDTPDNKPLGFQVTFFRTATGKQADNPSQFAPKQLIIAHVALSDPKIGKLIHTQKSAREGFGLAYASQTDTDVKLDNWHLVREQDGQYQVNIKTAKFGMTLTFTPTQPTLLQGNNGFSTKGPRPLQASYYYSEPHLHTQGTVYYQNKTTHVTGKAWLDHEWSSEYLDPNANGWDWVGANLNDGSAFMAFQIRHKNGSKLWAHAIRRNKNGQIKQFTPEQVEFTPLRTWQSPHTEATYPVAMRIRTGDQIWQLTPLFDDQELDSRQSTGAVYWEGAVTLTQDGKLMGKGYLELTGHHEPLNLD